jgi:hypothetical protein
MNLTRRPNILLGVLLAVLGLVFLASPAAAQSGSGETYMGDPLCLPEVYSQNGSNCLAMGPAETVTQLDKQGLSIPLRPLPASRPDASLSLVDSGFAKINLDNSEAAPIYSTLSDAVAQSNPVRYLEPGFLRYVAYVNYQDVDGKTFVQLSSGEWLRAGRGRYSTFQGLEFTATPRNDFGWIIDQASLRNGPGYTSTEIGVILPRETVVQVYDIVEQDGTRWYRIGLSQWVERRYIRIVSVNPTAPAGVDNNRWIEVNLYEQTLAIYEAGQLKFATLITSGQDPFFTRPGLFQIYEKKEKETMSGTFEADRSDYYYLQDVPWTMYFDEARALHGAYWRAVFGYPGSHGCVNLSIGDAHYLFNWAALGDWVYVWDPSGQTPTDASHYGVGGA